MATPLAINSQYRICRSRSRLRPRLPIVAASQCSGVATAIRPRTSPGGQLSVGVGRTSVRTSMDNIHEADAATRGRPLAETKVQTHRAANPKPKLLGSSGVFNGQHGCADEGASGSRLPWTR